MVQGRQALSWIRVIRDLRRPQEQMGVFASAHGPHQASVPKPLKHVLSLSLEKHSPFLWEGRTKDVAPALGKWREGCDWLPPAGHRELSVMIRTQQLEDRRPVLAGMLKP